MEIKTKNTFRIVAEIDGIFYPIKSEKSLDEARSFACRHLGGYPYPTKILDEKGQEIR